MAATTPRKRPRSVSSSSSHLPPDGAINPLSRTQRQLAQFAVAGLTETDPDPAVLDPLFPHRGTRRQPGSLLSPAPEEDDGQDVSDGDSGGNDGDDDEMGGKVKQSKGKPRTPGRSEAERHVRTLLESIYHFLDAGHIARAARAYAIVLRLQPDGRPLDVRRHHLWAIGIEILMREGEEPPPSSPTVNDDAAAATDDDDDDDSDKEPASLGEQPASRRAKRARWGSAANMAKVRAYLETLIQHHPYDHRRPNALSAVDFHLALLRCEVYSVQAEHRIAVQRSIDGDRQGARTRAAPRVGGAGGGGDVDMDSDIDYNDDDANDAQGTSGTSTSDRERRAAELHRLRRKTIVDSREIAHRMGRLMQDQPYSNHPQYQQLLATLSAYIAELQASTDKLKR